VTDCVSSGLEVSLPNYSPGEIKFLVVGREKGTPVRFLVRLFSTNVIPPIPPRGEYHRSTEGPHREGTEPRRRTTETEETLDHVGNWEVLADRSNI